MNSSTEILKKLLLKHPKTLGIDCLFDNEFLCWEDENANIISVSPSCEQITGYSVDDLIGNSKLFENIIFKEDYNIWQKRSNDLLSTDVSNCEFRIHHKSKRIIYIQQKSQRIFENNTFIGIKILNRDITNQKLTKEIINASTSVLFLWKNEPNFPAEFVTENVSNLLGYSVEDFTSGKIIYNNLIHPDCIKRVLSEVDKNKSEKNHSYLHQPYKIITKDGQIKWVSDNTSIRYDSFGNITHFHGIVSDISESKNAIDKLKQSEEIYRNVFNHSPLGILHFDKNGVITDCNEEFSSIIGTNKNNLIGFNMLTTLKDLELKEVVQKSLTIGSGVYKNFYTSVISGKTIPVVGRFNAVYSDGKQIIGGVGLIEDITDRNNHEKLQKALFEISATSSKMISIRELYKELHEIIKRLMPAENLFVAIHNKQTNLITFPYHVDKYDSPPKPKNFGNGLAEYILRTKTSQIISADMDKELQKKGEVELSGESAQIWVGVYLDFEGDYQGVLALQDYENPDAYSQEDLKVLQFVSEQIVKVLDKKYADRRLLESVEQLSLAKKELEVINKNKDMFFSIIAHDLRAPFNTLLGVTEMISGNMDDMSMKEVKEISSVIHSSTNNLFKLIENLLSWSRLQMGVFQINPVKLSILEVINDVLEVVSYSALDKKIMIENKITDLNAIVDKECLKTVARNLISNAIKFTNRFGNIILSSVELENHIQITIKDNGVGIKEEAIPKLFSISSKTSTIGTESEKGTGLGLILCKDLIEKNNGTIWVKSQFGKGSEFSFTIPKPI